MRVVEGRARWYRGTSHVNLPGAPEGHAVVELEDGRLRLETVSAGLRARRASHGAEENSMDAVGYRLQRVRASDSDLALMRELNAVFADAFSDPDSYLGHAPEDDYLRSVLGREETLVLVARVDDRVVGGLVAYELPKLEQRRSEVYVYDLAVLEAYRRKGIARALMEQLRTLAAARGASVVFVQADDGDAPAIALYASLGARKVVNHFDIDVDESPSGEGGGASSGQKPT
ncbi:GNAT family N-acetyltransferase [Myxococcus sp. Y35]|uniref:GNAT family N-acetyltransferase n=1 Tax=Pseudomyxococcus flavus TaxID=3115648 RepID=UPI003CF9434E